MLSWCQVLIQFLEPKLYFRFSVLLVKQQPKTTADSYPAVAKKNYPEILFRGLRLNNVPSVNLISGF